MRKIKSYKKLIHFLFLICGFIVFPSCAGLSDSIIGDGSVEIKASDKYGVSAFKIYPELYTPPAKGKEHVNKEIFNQPIEIIKYFVEKVVKGDMDVLNVPTDLVPDEVRYMYSSKRELQAAKSVEKNEAAGVFKITLENYLKYTDHCGSFPMLDSYGGREADSHRIRLCPKILVYEIRLSRVSDSQTSVEVNLKETKGWLLNKRDNLYDIEDKYFPDIERLVTCTFRYNYGYNYETQIIYGIKLGVIKFEYQENQTKLKAEKKRKKEEAERKKIEEQKAREEKSRIEEKQRLARKNDLLQKYLPKCNNSILSFVEFITGKNPHADKGKCTLIVAETFQMTSEKTGLFKTGSEIFYIDFPKTFRGPYVRGIAKIKGVYTYPSRLGANTVPHLQIIDELSDSEYYLLENIAKQIR